MYKFINQLRSIGIDNSLSFDEKLRVELCNLFVAISFIPSALHLVYNLFTDNVVIEYIIIGIWMLITAVTISLNYKKKYNAAKSIVIIGPLLFCTILRILYGPEIRIEPMFLLLILVSSYLFKSKIAIGLYAFNISCYLSTIFILDINPPPFADIIVASGAYAYLAFAILSVIILTTMLLWENKRFNEMLSQKNLQLESKNEELQRFTYIASHDLKTPLRNIRNYAGLIHKNLKNDKAHNIDSHLGFIDQGIEQMYFLINDISQFNRIENDLSQSRQKVDLNQVIAQVRLTLKSVINSDSIVVKTPLSTFKSNSGLIQLVFQNIIENALKYNNSKHPQVTIKETSVENMICISFEDNGIGIDSTYHHQIFDYFKRLHTKDAYSGTGLGLGICKKIINAYDGEISVQSMPGAGSIFTIKLPISLRV